VLYRFLDVHKPKLSQVKAPNELIFDSTNEQREESTGLSWTGEAKNAAKEAERLNKRVL
jgi:hypothetical protein